MSAAAAPAAAAAADQEHGLAVRLTRSCGYHGAMSRLLLNLRHVLDDEADEVRAMLEANGIAFYETRPGAWGISAGGIFVDEDGILEAKRLMADYQAQRGERVRAELAAERRAGTAETFAGLLRSEPGRVALHVLAAVLVVLMLVVLPVLLLR